MRQVARRRALRRRRRRPGRPGRRQRHRPELPLPQPGRRQVRGDRHHLGDRLRPAGAARGGMGIDWADFKNDGSLGLAIGNFANEMIALYVTDDPASLQFSDLANLYGLGRPDAAPAEVRPVLLRLRPRRPARPALGQRPPRERHRQGPGDRDLRAVGPALLEHRPARPHAVRRWSARRRPVPTCSARSSAGAAPTPTSTATATSTSS